MFYGEWRADLVIIKPSKTLPNGHVDLPKGNQIDAIQRSAISNSCRAKRIASALDSAWYKWQATAEPRRIQTRYLFTWSAEICRATVKFKSSNL
jgi:hypothetical protein